MRVWILCFASGWAWIVFGDGFCSLGEDANGHESGGEAGCGTDREGPAWPEAIGAPRDNGGADRHSAKSSGYAQGHHSSPHGGFCGELHDAVGAVGEGEHGRTADGESGAEPPVSGRESGQSAAEAEDTGSCEERREAWFLSACSKQ